MNELKLVQSCFSTFESYFESYVSIVNADFSTFEVTFKVTFQLWEVTFYSWHATLKSCLSTFKSYFSTFKGSFPTLQSYFFLLFALSLEPSFFSRLLERLADPLEARLEPFWAWFWTNFQRKSLIFDPVFWFLIALLLVYFLNFCHRFPTF